MLPVLVLLDGSGAGSQRQRAKQHHGYGIRVGSRLKCMLLRIQGTGLWAAVYQHVVTGVASRVPNFEHPRVRRRAVARGAAAVAHRTLLGPFSYAANVHPDGTEIREISTDWFSGQSLPKRGCTLGGLAEIMDNNVQRCLAAEGRGTFAP